MNIELTNISLTKNKRLFDSFSRVFNKGINIVMGASGIGKTTLLRLLLGFELADKGDIFFGENKLDADNIPDIRSKISWIPQNFKNFNNTDTNNIIKKLGINKADLIKNLKYFNLKFENKELARFSTGELQRIFLAIAKTQNREILLADEPSSALDTENKIRLIKYLKSHEGTVICVTHDSDLVDISNSKLELKGEH